MAHPFGLTRRAHLRHRPGRVTDQSASRTRVHQTTTSPQRRSTSGPAGSVVQQIEPAINDKSPCELTARQQWQPLKWVGYIIHRR